MLMLRTGYIERPGRTSGTERTTDFDANMALGVVSSVEMARWVWNYHFDAVAGDISVFDVIPRSRKSMGSRDCINRISSLTRC